MKKIETRPAALQRQQMILTVFGHYNGKCDGIWGPDSFAAMRKFEASGKFSPAIPRGGNPLGVSDRLPPNVFRDTVTASPGQFLLTCTGLTAEKIEELAGGLEEETTDNKDVVTQGGDTFKATDANTDGDQDSEGTVGQAGPEGDEGNTDPATQQNGSGEVELSALAQKDPADLTKRQKKLLRKQQNAAR